MVARQQEPLAQLQKELDGGTVTSLNEALPQADIVVWVASMPKTIEIDTDNLKKPCLMIDGGYPKNLDEKFQGENIHVLKGGIVPPPGSPTCARIDSSTRADTTVRVDRRHSSRSTPPIVSGTAAVIVTSTNRRVWSGWWPSLTSRVLDALSWGGDWRAVGLRPTEAPTLTTFPTRVSTASTTDLGGRLGGIRRR